MHKDEQFYTFVFSRSTKNYIRVRRLEVSRRWLQTCAGVAVMSLGAVSYSFYGVVIQAANTQIAQIAQNRVKINSPRTESERNEQSSAQMVARIEIPKQTQSEKIAQNYPNSKTHDGEGGPIEPNSVSNIPQQNAQNVVTSQALNPLENSFRNTENTPSIYPIIGKINDEFGWRHNPFGGGSYEKHPGLDIDGEKGDAVVAPADGTVLRAEWSNGYGNLLEIDHGGGLITRYGHLSEIEVKPGDAITRGQFIAKVGSTGRSTGPHLHYEIRVNNEPVNPHLYLPQLPENIVQ